MTVYAETSAVLRWLCAEEGGEGLRNVLAAAEKVAASRLTLIAQKRGQVQLDFRNQPEQYGIHVDKWTCPLFSLAVFAQAASTWATLEISEEISRRAEDGFPNEPLRNLDAIHMARALFFRQSFPDLVVVSVDERLQANAAPLGFQIADAL